MSDIASNITQPLQNSEEKQPLAIQKTLPSDSDLNESLPLKKSLQQQLDSQWQKILLSHDGAQLTTLIQHYTQLVLKQCDDHLFASYFAQTCFFEVLHKKMKELAHCGQLLRAVFRLFEYLLQALKRDQDLVFFLLKVNKQGFVREGAPFREQQDWAYYAHFLKLMSSKINKDVRFVDVFVNSRQPHFPLLLQLLKMLTCLQGAMRTESKLAILQLSKNGSELVQKYLGNFPFVLFYPLCMGEVMRGLREAVEGMRRGVEGEGEELEGGLKYMEDFLGEKERVAVDMYTNSFLGTVGRYVYWEMVNLHDKNIGRTVALLKVLLDRVLPELTVVKVRTALFYLFSPSISGKLKKCFQSREVELNNRYWLPESCQAQVIGHCGAVLFKAQPSSKSFIKGLSSYIPRTTGNWLFHELKKLGQTIGFQVDLNEPIDSEKYLSQSFLTALFTMIDDKWSRNQVFGCVLRARSEELMYYYLRVLGGLADAQGVEGRLQLQQILGVVASCSSHALVQGFYNLVGKTRVKVGDLGCVEEVYERLTQKLVHFVMTKGWRELILRIWDSRLPENDRVFTGDIYRELECDILLFVALRGLLGTSNAQCVLFDTAAWENYPPLTCQTIIKGRESDSNGAVVNLSLDGQYLNLKNSEEVLINKQELLLGELKFWEEGERLLIVGSDRCGRFQYTVHVQLDFLRFLMKEVRGRRQMADRISLELRQMLFAFRYQ